MDAVRGCGDSPPCPGFKDGGTCPTEEVLSASCLLHGGTGIQSSHLFVINNRLKALAEDEGREEMFMKHLFTMLLALVAATASAQDFVVDGICYNILSEDDRTVMVTESPYGYSGEVVIPAEVTYDGSTYSVTTIGDLAFGYCSALTSVSMPSVTTIGNSAFERCSALTSVEMPSVTTIGAYAFYECSSLTSISMPSVTTIGGYAFYYCNALTSVSMPSATTIGYGAFYYCFALTSIDIPASVSMIDDYAFTACSSLTSVYCHWEDPLECDPRFENTVLETATLYVPTGTIDAYRSVSPWSEFLNIEEKDYSGIADTHGSEVTVTVIDGAISIEGGDGTASAPVVEVYSAGGQCIYRGTDSSIGGLGHGIYVVRVGGTVQKVAL